MRTHAQNKTLLVAGVAGVALVGGLVLLARSSSAGVDDGRPIHVAGDSYAVGIADALRKQHPKRARPSESSPPTSCRH